jgi:nucleotide-binding universal stress UspA family protein
MFETILWATDGSENGDRALPYAKALAKGEGRKLVVLHCKELGVGHAGGYPVQADEDQLEAKIRQQVEQAQAEGIEVTFNLVAGPVVLGPAHMIADAADEVGADLIIVGTRGHTTVTGLLLGGVAQRLLHIASCPVLAVPPEK